MQLHRREPKAGEDHHWWPKGLLKKWKDINGKVSILYPDGKLWVVESGHPRPFTNPDRHNILPTSTEGWGKTGHSFESYFDEADRKIPNVVSDLKQISEMDCSEFYTPFKLNDQIFDDLCKICASLIARSPRTYLRWCEHANKHATSSTDIGYQNIIALNQENVYNAAYNSIKKGGKFAFLKSDLHEFCFGDGILNNIDSGNYRSHARFIIPLLPNMAMLYYRPLEYWVNSNGFVFQMNEQNVKVINEITQIYALDMICFKNHAPILTSKFKQKVIQIPDHHPDIFEKITEIMFSQRYDPRFSI